MLDLFVALFGMLFCRILICLVRKNQLCIMLARAVRVVDATQVTFDLLGHVSNLITFLIFIFTLVVKALDQGHVFCTSNLFFCFIVES